MTGTSVIITFNGNYIHSSDRPYSDFDIGRGIDKHIRHCIDGTKTGCGKCVGYCTYYEHTGFLTDSLRKKHNCLKKGCRYYVPKDKASITTFINKEYCI